MTIQKKEAQHVKKAKTKQKNSTCYEIKTKRRKNSTGSQVEIQDGVFSANRMTAHGDMQIQLKLVHIRQSVQNVANWR